MMQSRCKNEFVVTTGTWVPANPGLQVASYKRLRWGRPVPITKRFLSPKNFVGSIADNRGQRLPVVFALCSNCSPLYIDPYRLSNNLYIYIFDQPKGEKR